MVSVVRARSTSGGPRPAVHPGVGVDQSALEPAQPVLDEEGATAHLPYPDAPTQAGQEVDLRTGKAEDRSGRLGITDRLRVHDAGLRVREESLGQLRLLGTDRTDGP